MFTCLLADKSDIPLSVRVVCQQTREDTGDALLLCPKMPRLPTFNHTLESSARFSLDHDLPLSWMDRLKSTAINERFLFFVANPQQEMHHLKNRLDGLGASCEQRREKTRKAEGIMPHVENASRWNDWLMMGSVLIEVVKVGRTLGADGGRMTAKRWSAFKCGS